jgi:acyl transferase domain-containing protein/acyl carrier protein
VLKHGEIPGEESLRLWIVENLAKILGVDARSINPSERLEECGIGSSRVVELIQALENVLGHSLPALLIREYPTIDALARHLAGGREPSADSSRLSVLSADEPIAVIGLACRFPGAPDPRAFWRLLREGIDAVGEIPEERFDARAFYSPDPAVPGKMSTRWGGFLEQVDRFDAAFFSISPREAEQMDPQQRLALELAWEALEDAGLPPSALRGSTTGVYMGAMWSDYAGLVGRHLEAIAPHTTTGQDLSVIAGRISYTLGFQGPSLTVNTGCSASLVAVHLACQAIRAGECLQAVAGGVSLILSPYGHVAMSKFGAMSPGGRCRTFDARADGYVRGEGGGMVVLKPLRRAVLDGDTVVCVIRGSAVNNDGLSDGLKAPNPEAQRAVLRDAYARAGVAPERVHYVEAHGTGTALGDPVEAEALGAVLGANRVAGQPLRVGSVKTNVGHLEPAAGIAGLIKVALALEHQALPPSLHFEEPNPRIPFEALRLSVQRTLEPWPVAGERPLAGVSAFSFNGTNGHVVLEGSGPFRPVEEAGRDRSEESRAELLTFTAHTPAALRERVVSTRSLLEAEPVPLRDVAFTLTVRREHLPHRLAVVARSQAELGARLEAFLRGEPLRGLARGERGREGVHRCVFILSGQGGQWQGMGRELLRGNAAFRAALEQCDKALAPHLHGSVVEELSAGNLRGTMDYVQPLLFAVQVALAAVWRSWGIEPDAVVGHSMGEVAAAHLAGALSLEDAARIICVRSRALARLAGRGTMVLVELPAEQVHPLLVGHSGRVSVAAINGPSSTVLSGEKEALTGLVAELERRGVDCRWVQVDVAAHSPQTEELREEVQTALEGILPRPHRVPIYSTVTGGPMDGTTLGSDYWVRNLREPVRFFEAVSRLCAEGHRVFLEVGPHPVLAQAVEETLRHLGHTGKILASTRRGEDERAAMLEGLGALYVDGHPVRFEGVYPEGGRVTRLAPYPWQRRRFWIEAPPMDEPAATSRAGAGHPLLGTRVESSLHEGTHLWEVRVEAEALGGHSVRGLRMVSGGVIAELVLAAARELEVAVPEVKDLHFTEPLLLPESHGLEAQLAVTSEGAGGFSFQLSSRRRGERRAGAWRVHATGRLGSASAPVGQDWQGEGMPAPAETRSEVQACLEALLQRCALAGVESCVLAEISSLVSWGHASPSSRIHAQSTGELSGNVALLDEHGKPVLEARGVRFHRLKAGLLHVVEWRHEPWRPALDMHGGRWLILADRGGVGQRLAALLEARGHDCAVVLADRDGLETGSREVFQELLETARPDRGVVYLWGLDASAGEPPVWERECARLLALVQALALTRWVEPPRLWAVAGGGAAAPEVGVPLAQAASWGLGRVLVAEHPGLRFTSISLGAEPLTEVEGLARLLRSEEDAEQLALRCGARLVPRLARLEAPVRPGVPVRPDGMYLVTGGSGALGAAAACELAERGAGMLVLLSRGEPGEAAREARRSMERAGARVVEVRADVSDREQLVRVLEGLRREPLPLRGVIHAAGRGDDAPLLELDREQLRSVFAPKALGAWHLHSLTRDEPLDFFVMFSSVASWQGVPGQGAYAAANAFLDGLAQHRRAMGLPALSIGWGGWQGLGLAATRGGERALEHLARNGLERLSREEGLAALGELLQRDVPARVLAVPVVPSALEGRGGDRAAPEQPSAAAGFRETLLATQPVARRRAMLEAYVGEQAAHVLRLPVSELDPRAPLRELGLDSMMAVQLRNRLEVGLGLVLSMTLLWRWATVEALAEHLAGMLGAGSPGEAASQGESEEPLSELLSELEQLSDEEVRRRLEGG